MATEAAVGPQGSTRMSSTIKQEAEVARRHTPDIAWPTVALAFGCLGLLAVSSWLALTGTIPLALAMVLNTVAMYATYTPVHDGSHSAIAPRSKKLRWLNVVIGTMAGFPIFMCFYAHRKSHFIHHAKTNTPGDPDTFLMGAFWEVVLVKTPWSLVNQLNGIKLWQSCEMLNLTPQQRRTTMIQYGITVVLLVGLVADGYGVELLTLWLIPWFVGEHVMEVTFGWFPHYDNSETGRYRNTRISLFPGADFLYVYQHLVHHMLPAVPFYRYRAVFDELRPTLEEHGARIEGFWPYSKPSAT
jgi:beta-carotene hydroxylase